MTISAQDEPTARWAAVSLTVVLYLATGLSMATIGVIVPFMAPLGRAFAASGTQLGFAIALFSLPSALVAIAGGAITDAIGVRRALIASTLIGLAGDAMTAGAHSLSAFDAGLFVCGIGFAGISVSAPAAIVVALDGGPQIRAMSFWSTYAPTGYAVGLLIAVPFVGEGAWRTAIGWHGAALALVCPLLLMMVPARARGAEQRAPRMSLRALFGDGAILRLGLAVAVPNGISYGVSLVAPSYLARVHDVGLSVSSGAVAVAKIAATVFGGLATGYLLSRRVAVARLYALLAVGGIAAQIVLFAPHGSFALALAGLIAWLFCFGGMAGSAMAKLASVVKDPTRIGLASGAIGQLISIASFAAPPVYFGIVDWPAFCAIAAGGLVLALVALPRGG